MQVAEDSLGYFIGQHSKFAKTSCQIVCKNNTVHAAPTGIRVKFTSLISHVKSYHSEQNIFPPTLTETNLIWIPSHLYEDFRYGFRVIYMKNMVKSYLKSWVPRFQMLCGWVNLHIIFLFRKDGSVNADPEVISA